MSSEPGLFVPPRVDAMLGGHRKIEAIKAVLDANPGASLRAAKAAVDARIDALAAGSAPSSSSSSSADDVRDVSGLPAAAVEALLRGQVIEAIKLVRLAHGVDLRTAKQRVEAHMRGDAGAAAAASREPVATTGDLPADVLALLRAGDRGAAWQLLERKYGATSAQALRRIAEHEIARKQRGAGGGATVAAGDNNGRVMLWALLVAIAAVAVWWFVW
jgi:ribosomal protein L7/L12